LATGSCKDSRLAAKVALFLEETGLRYEIVPVDTGRLFFIATGLGPFSGQAVHFQRATPEKLPYAINRYRREAERHYTVLDQHLAGRDFIVGNGYTIADISGWGWVDRASFVLPGSDDPLAAYPNIRQWFHAIDARPAVARARAIGSSHIFKKEVDEETRRALFPSNYPPAAA
jgi:GST-like protein